MKISRLARLLEEFQPRLGETQALAAEIQSALAAALANPDPFARLVFQARADFRRTIATDLKSGRRTKEHTRDTYREAAQLGFRGDERAWYLILDATASSRPLRPAAPGPSLSPD